VAVAVAGAGSGSWSWLSGDKKSTDKTMTRAGQQREVEKVDEYESRDEGRGGSQAWASVAWRLVEMRARNMCAQCLASTVPAQL
jgi:hypothetical protein